MKMYGLIFILKIFAKQVLCVITIFTIAEVTTAQCFFSEANTNAKAATFSFTGTGDFGVTNCPDFNPVYTIGKNTIITIAFGTPQNYPGFRVFLMTTNDSASVKVNGVDYPLTSSSASYSTTYVCGGVAGCDGVSFANNKLAGANVSGIVNYNYSDIQLHAFNVTSITITTSGMFWFFLGALSSCPAPATPALLLSVVNKCDSSILTVSNATGPLLWSDGSKETSPRTVIIPGNYSVAQLTGKCVSILSDTVTAAPIIVAPPSLDVVNGCKHAVLTTSDATGTLLWDDGSNAASPRSVAKAGTYSVAQTIGNCTSAFSNKVTATLSAEGPGAILGRDTVLCPGESLLLDPGVYATYLWQDNSTSRNFTVTQSGTYRVIVTDNDSCTFSAAVNVQTLINCNNVYFPTAFSPNKDGINETFGVLGNLRDISNYKLNVYDKYGNIIFTTTDPYRRWNGFYKNAIANTANYVWEASYTYKGNQKIIKKGNVLLIH